MKYQNSNALFRLGCIFTILLLQPFSFVYATGNFILKSFPQADSTITLVDSDDATKREVTLHFLTNFEAGTTTIDPGTDVTCCVTEKVTDDFKAEAEAKTKEKEGTGSKEKVTAHAAPLKYTNSLGVIFPPFSPMHSTYCFSDKDQAPYEVAPVMLIGFTVFLPELGKLIASTGTPLKKITGDSTQLTVGLTGEEKILTWHFPCLPNTTIQVVIPKVLHRRVVFKLVTDLTVTKEFVYSWESVSPPVFYTKAMQKADFIVDKNQTDSSTASHIASQTTGAGKFTTTKTQ
ncbi:hypothetical protein [Spongorhabdus nitratireducens]